VRLIAFSVLQLAANVLAVQAADYFIPNVSFSGDFLALLKVGVIITALNIFAKPIAKLILAPFILLTLGLVGLLINAALLWLATYWAPEFSIDTYLALGLATLLFTAINILFGIFARSRK
jgi:putative membrane protein